MSDWLKPASIVALVTLLLLPPSIQDRLAEETTRYIEDNESSHHGLPSDWMSSKSSASISSDSPHSEFNLGVTMIGPDGNEIGTNDDLNRTGACVGGFGGTQMD